MSRYRILVLGLEGLRVIGCRGVRGWGLKFGAHSLVFVAIFAFFLFFLGGGSGFRGCGMFRVQADLQSRGPKGWGPGCSLALVFLDCGVYG